jgi:dATP/dGTP diphosphohydrolase
VKPEPIILIDTREQRPRTSPAPTVAADRTTIEKLFPVALRIVASVMRRGARTHQGKDWRAFPVGFHLARARRHLALLAAGDTREPHLFHAACRLLMELEHHHLSYLLDKLAGQHTKVARGKPRLIVKTGEASHKYVQS